MTFLNNRPNGENMLVKEKSKPRTREDQILMCYKAVFPVAASYVRRQGGSLEDTQEVFQQALVAFYERSQNVMFQPEQEDQAYLMGIFKNLWIKHRSHSQRFAHLDDFDLEDEKNPSVIKQKLVQYLKQSGERCMELLQSFYYEKLSMKQLAERFGYVSERSVTVQKYKCLEKVRNEVRQKSLQYEDFFE